MTIEISYLVSADPVVQKVKVPVPVVKTVERKIPVHVPVHKPFPVPVERKVAYPVKVPGKVSFFPVQYIISTKNIPFKMTNLKVVINRFQSNYMVNYIN